MPENSLHKPAAIFWDMDGTLTDSEPLWAKATYYISELMGRRLTPELRMKTVGASFTDTFRICAEWAGLEPKPGDKEYYQKAMFDFARGLYDTELEIFAGVPELLRELDRDGMTMLLTTNTQRSVADPVIDAIGRELFDDTICGDEVPEGKPAPDMYREAARRVGAEPGDCLVFEDSTAGMTAAVAAGCVVIGLPADDTVAVPEGVTLIGDIHSAEHLVGATMPEVYRWFGELRGVAK